MDNFLFPYIISVLTIILGFIALLAQRIYIDKDTKQATQIKIPIIGKMKTNYPALIFVFVGIGLAAWVFNKDISLKQHKMDITQKKPKIKWKVTGSFITNDGKKIDWEKGSLALFPTDFTPTVTEKGKFTINAEIEEGKRFSEVIQLIDYSHPVGRALIIPSDEYENHSNGLPSRIAKSTKSSIEYKPIVITPF